jgi:hypothetical protein
MGAFSGIVRFDSLEYSTVILAHLHLYPDYLASRSTADIKAPALHQSSVTYILGFLTQCK